MKEIIVLSGKGGAGKTTVTSCLSVLIQNKVICDCDVEGANLHLLLQGQVQQTELLSLGKVAAIDQNICNNCKKCIHYCRFNAITTSGKYCKIIPAKCEGCKVCTIVCPNQAINMQQITTGEIIQKISPYGHLFYAELLPGKGNSGRLVTELKNRAKATAKALKAPILLIDGPPGIGCPTISSLTGTELVILVIESSISGIEDATRLWKLANKFHIQTVAIINKYGICKKSDDFAIKFLQENSIPLLGTIAFHKEINYSQLNGIIPIQYFSREIFTNLLYYIKYE